jgi:DNA sulfur modification protein DndD
MQVKSIQLCNFRRYKQKQDPIEFSTDPDKNVTAILGFNTAGKTTIIQAFLWCLYGTFKIKDLKTGRIRESKPEDVINADAELDLMPNKYCDVFVEIVLIHENKEFIIRRTQRFSLNVGNKLKADDASLKIEWKDPSGNQSRIPANECKATVQKILPEALSDYFFFDGERITDINNRGDVVAAVRGLMGLDVIGEARNRLDPKRSGSVTSKMKNELDLGSDAESTKLKSTLKTKQDELSQTIERIATAKDEIDFFLRRKEEIKDKLVQNAQAKELQKRRAGFEKDVAAYRRNITDSAGRILADFRKDAVAFFALPLIDKAISVIENCNQDGEGIPEMRQGAIDYILQRGKCICGCELSDNEGARKRIGHERDLLPPEHIGTSLRDHKGRLLKFRDDTSKYVSSIQGDYRSWRRNINDLDEKQKDLKDVSDDFAALGVTDEDVAQIERTYQTNDSALQDKQRLLENLISKKGAVENEIANAERRIDSLAAASDKNKVLQKRIRYAEALFEWFDNSYSGRESEVKKNLLESVNRIFAEMYHGKRIVTIDDKYHITLLAQVASQQRSIDESRGLEAVKNFSFVAGLVDIARQKMSNNSSLESDQEELTVESEAFPLVMDAPFSNADEVHINNISRIIPRIAEQIILIVMQKDWEYAKPALEGRIGKCYTIETIDGSETYSMIREGE